MSSKKVGIIAVGNTSGETGGAEKFCRGLTNALCSGDLKAEIVTVMSDESSFDAIQETYLRFYDLDLSRYDAVISTKAPAYLVRHANHICYLQHTMRVFYDMFEFEFPNPSEELLKQRELIHKLDTGALYYPRTKKVFVIGNEVRDRLWNYNGIDAEVIYQALTFNKFRCGDSYQYIFMPGRLHRWKRVDLVLKAMKFVKAPLVLKIAGIGEDEKYFMEQASGNGRIEFLGRVSNDELGELYANALVVPFVPIREDFGLITLEAFASCKPVVTCIDSGEPSYIVKDGETGFICRPEPQEIAAKLEYFYDYPDRAREMGLKGRRSIEHITWEKVCHKLITALELS